MKRSPELLNKRIMELDEWLLNNPSHIDYSIILKDKLKLKNELIKVAK